MLVIWLHRTFELGQRILPPERSEPPGRSGGSTIFDNFLPSTILDDLNTLSFFLKFEFRYFLTCDNNFVICISIIDYSDIEHLRECEVVKLD